MPPSTAAFWVLLTTPAFAAPVETTGTTAIEERQIEWGYVCDFNSYAAARYCQTYCQGALMGFNETRCPIGSNDADDILSDCSCQPYCTLCGEEEAVEEDEEEESSDERLA